MIEEWVNAKSKKDSIQKIEIILDFYHYPDEMNKGTMAKVKNDIKLYTAVQNTGTASLHRWTPSTHTMEEQVTSQIDEGMASTT